MRRRRGGFTLIELLASMTIIAILAGIMIPKTGDFINQAKATAAVSDIQYVQQAVNSYLAAAPTDSTSLPPTAAMGQVPDAFRPDLGANYSFIKGDYTLQYNNWTFYQSVGGQTTSQTIIGITMQTKNARLGALVMEKLPLPHFQWGQNDTQDYTFIVYGLQ
ncbi:MAG TPA: prepilin-type N-terminal cleavage/methylation domain-containing protein [Gemmatimonadaceae bacterium]|nr:prepilin-type N-terminal cleavage/methylation domain-containing protein [Gemmatimonadaceae bacterium]